MGECGAQLMSDVPEKKCLDHGFVRLIDHMGNDKRIVDAARVSYQKGTKKVSTDRGLIRYLLRNLHTTPFEKVRFEFHVKLPIFVARQWMRHRTGSFNEVSGRYSEMPNEMYTPQPIRKQSETNRQGSSDESLDDAFLDLYDIAHEKSYEIYQTLLANDAAKELARGVLPLNLYTEFYWTVDLWNLMHFLRLRIDGHAQLEIRVFAQAIFDLIMENCDLEYALEAFIDYIVERPKITKFELDALLEYVTEYCPETMHKDIRKLLEANTKVGKREIRESELLARLATMKTDGDTDEVLPESDSPSTDV
jgi:thymidylate synthase (FAD)